MKLLVQVDDFALTPGVADGVITAIRDGLCRATGIFINQPWAEYAIRRIQDYPQCSLGIDINVVCGPCTADPKQLPTLVDQNTGCFVPSRIRVQDPQWGKKDFYPEEEVFIEGCAQIEKFIQLTGKKPAYIQNHAVRYTEGYRPALRRLCQKYRIPYMDDIKEKYNIVALKRPENTDNYSFECQMRDMEMEMLELLEENQHLKYAFIPSHCGYLDRPLFDYSRYTYNRFQDLAMVTSEKIRKWCEDHQVQILNIDDLPMD